MKKNNYSKQILKTVFFLSLLCISTLTFTYSSGPPGQYTNAPSEGNCTSCHSGTAISSGTSWSAITLSGLPAGGYIPATTYTLTLTGSTAASGKNGFQLTALTSSNTAAGSFIAGTGSSTQTLSSRNYVGHNSSGTSLSSFTFSWTSPSSSAGTLTFFASFNATNGDNSSSGDAVYVKTFSVSAGNLPTAVISPATGSNICLGDTLSLQGSGANSPTSYAWSFLGSGSGEPTGSPLQNPQIKYLTTGPRTIRLITSNSSGNSTQAQITIFVIAKPIASITPSGPQVICGGDSITLSATAGTGLSYLWSPGNQTSQLIKAGAPGTYSVKVTNLNNCFSISPNTIVTAASKPSLSITTSKDTSCVTDSVQITATIGQNYYKYFINNVRVDSTVNSSIKRKFNAGINQISVISNNGNCNSDLVLKTIYSSNQDPAPTINCGIASSSMVSFIIAGTNPQISLDSGKTWLSTNAGSRHTLNGLNPNQQIYAQARSVNGGVCINSLTSSKTCVANACQPITFKLEYLKRNCLKSNIDTVLVPVLISALNISNFAVNFNNSGYTKSSAYMAKVINGNNLFNISIIDSSNLGCGAKDTVISLTGINPIAASPVLSLGSAPICSNGSVTIITTKPAGAAIFKYYKNNDSVPFIVRPLASGPDLVSVPLINFNLNNHDFIKIGVEDLLDGCVKSSAPIQLNFVTPVKAGFTYIKENLKIFLAATGSNRPSYSWNFGDGTILTTVLKVKNYSYATAGIYKITLSTMDSNGCNSADTQTVNIVATGIQQNLFRSGQMKIYPNPASQLLNINWNRNLGTEAKFILFDLQGNEVINQFISIDEQINLLHIAKGAYFIKVELNQQTGWQKLLIE
ncbi:MAG: T9SS type A sorting domain-containing protein [Bacteroidia bacterium]|nr:T9SS type A sorting domain-containing protein [Bacteroidia bacterium]